MGSGRSASFDGTPCSASAIAGTAKLELGHLERSPQFQTCYRNIMNAYSFPDFDWLSFQG